MNIYVDGLIYSLQKRGGITRYTDELIEGLARENIEVNVLMHKKYHNEPPRAANISIQYVNGDPGIDFSNKLFKYLLYPRDSVNSKRYFKSIDKGLLHSTYYTAYSGLKIPQIISVYDMMHEKLSYFKKLKDKMMLYKKKMAIKSADAVICISEQTASDLKECYKIDSKKIFVVPLGVDEKFLENRNLDKSVFFNSKKIALPYILFVGNRSLYKNFDSFIRAFASWTGKDGFSVVLAGGGSINKEEKKLIEKLGLKEKILSFNSVSDNELISFYSCANAFIFPSLYEGFGLPLLEAMASGTLVLASDIPVFREIGGDIPVFFDPKSIKSIADSFGHLARDNSERIAAGIIRAKKFRWENTVKKTIDIYKTFNI